VSDSGTAEAGWMVVSLFDVRLTNLQPVKEIFHSRRWFAFIDINELITPGEGGAFILRPVQGRVFYFSVFTPST
jgi:hypothetical protein